MGNRDVGLIAPEEQLRVSCDPGEGKGLFAEVVFGGIVPGACATFVDRDIHSGDGSAVEGQCVSEGDVSLRMGFRLSWKKKKS